MMEGLAPLISVQMSILDIRGKKTAKKLKEIEEVLEEK